MKLSVALLAVLASGSAVDASKYLRPRKLSEDEVCTALIAVVEYEGRRDESHVACEFADGDILDVETEDGWDADVISKGELKSGLMDLECPGCVRVGSKLRVPPGSAKLRNRGGGRGQGQGAGSGWRRHLAVVTGTKTVLAVRVNHIGPGNLGNTTDSQAQIAKDVFGAAIDAADDNVCLHSQYLDCSHGQLDFQPAPTKGTNNSSKASDIVDGSTTVTVSTDCTSTPCDGQMRNDVNSALNNAFGQSASSLADHVMHCLPNSAMSGIAYAYINSWNSVYSNRWCQYLSTQMHEIGHNLNLAHSGEGSEQYADQSGMMGYSYSQFDGPLMCFNAAKSWQLQWYTGYYHTFQTSDGSWSGNLMGISNIQGQPTTFKAVVKINDSGSSTDYYINFNDASNYNSGTVEGQNQVMIVKAGAEGSGYALSSLLAKLSAGSSYTISALGVTVTVNSIDTGSNIANICIAASGQTCSTGCTADTDCDDSNLCTVDSCISGTCLNTDIVCNPSDACKVNARCEAGVCVEDDIVCDDGIFCNGQETCDVISGCQSGTPVSCPDDGLFCNGQEACDENTKVCASYNPPCQEDGNLCNGVMSCNESTDTCDSTDPIDCSNDFSVCGAAKVCNASDGTCVDAGTGEDGTCDAIAGEDCHICPNDCPSFELGAVCGNGICEDTESCTSCPIDCNGRTSGKRTTRFCCSGGPNGDCSNSGCNTSTFACTTDPTLSGFTCCGDGVCEGPEDFSNCDADCDAPAPTPPTPPPPTPTPPSPTPPTGCPFCPPINGECCGNCVDKGNPSRRGCFQ